MILLQTLNRTIAGNFNILARDVSGYDTSSIPEEGITVRNSFRDMRYRFVERVNDGYGFIDRFQSEEYGTILSIEHDPE